jgi:hypothetical protein
MNLLDKHDTPFAKRPPLFVILADAGIQRQQIPRRGQNLRGNSQLGIIKLSSARSCYLWIHAFARMTNGEESFCGGEDE